jgi:hypothetical protein
MPATTTPDPLTNTLPAINQAIIGTLNAFGAIGGFDMEAGFKTIVPLEQAQIESYDVTNSLQIVLDRAMFNTKLGTYDVSAQVFDNDSITINVTDLQGALLSAAQIVSPGAYTGMYSNFKTYVLTYFGVPSGFASLFTESTLFDLSMNDYDTLFGLLKATGGTSTGDSAGADDIATNYIRDLSGSITISNITQLLRFAVDTDLFGNRTPPLEDSGTGGDGTAIDANNTSNYGVGDGFIEGDLIFVPTGTQITLDLDISPEFYISPFNNPNASTASTFAGPSGTALNTLTNTQNAYFSSIESDGVYSSTSTVTRNSVRRVLKAPLLIRLVNTANVPSA